MSFGDDAPPPVQSRTARSRVLRALAALGPDEGEVLALVAERLAAGRRAYGELRPASDPRDFARECLEEAADGLVYVAAALVRAGGPWGGGRATVLGTSPRTTSETVGSETSATGQPDGPGGRLVGAERCSP